MTETLISALHSSFGMVPSDHQEQALCHFGRFLGESDKRSVFILRGAAGTGKTSLAAAFVRMLVRNGSPVVLLAPTGRAAKVFSLNSGQSASTIHRSIYRQKSIDADGGSFTLNYNKLRHAFFFVDEASMISHGTMGDRAFGKGSVLDDLVEFVYSGEGCRLVFIGDTVQLPPVGEERSPALDTLVLEGYGLKVYESDLNEVLRQNRHSGILWNATAIRSLVENATQRPVPRIRFNGFADVRMISGNELIDQLMSSYDQVGMDEVMVITRSNKQANVYNRGIRQVILDREEEIERGDMLMIVKNKYFETSPANTRSSDAGSDKPQTMKFVANGDRARVVRVRKRHEFYGFHFAEVVLDFPDYENAELATTIITDSLASDAPALTAEQNEALFQAVLADYEDIPSKKERIRKVVRDDVYFGALQVKYAYAITCHKAQGGQWSHIYIDQGYMNENMFDEAYIHWLYTAFTRATNRLFLINWRPELTLE